MLTLASWTASGSALSTVDYLMMDTPFFTVATQPEGVVVSDQEILARAQAQLLGAMALLETLDNKQELTEGGQL